VSRKRKSVNRVEKKLEEKLDKLAEFEEYEKDILPKLRDFVKEGRTASEITEFFQAYVTAQLVTMAMVEKDSGRRLAAIKEVLDRGIGKSTEKKEVTHKYDNLSEDEIKASIITKINKLSDSEEDELH
jgi:transcriptional regulator NrdR family protein